MPRFFFDVTDDRGAHHDDVGDDFESVQDARQHCQALLSDIMREELPNGELHVVKCEIRDEASRVVYRGKVTYKGELEAG